MSNIAFMLGKYAAWLLFTKTVGLFQGFFWMLNGTYFQVWRSRSKDNYDWSVQCLRIIWRHKFDQILEPSMPANFISTHHSFVHPEVMLQKDNITLYYLTPKMAVFVETDESIDAPSSEVAAFLRVAQFRHAKKIYLMPIYAFHKLTEQHLEDPKNLIFITNCTRSGSTLLKQIFENSGHVRAFSEPDALNAASIFKGHIPESEIRRVMINVMRMICKPVKKTPDIKHYAIKVTGPTLYTLNYMKDVFPKARYVYIYRNGLAVGQSLARNAASNAMPLIKLTVMRGKISAAQTIKGIQQMGLHGEYFNIKCLSGLHFCIWVWAVHNVEYLKYLREGVDIAGIKFEDLVLDKKYATSEIYKYCNLPEEWVEPSLAGFNKDAQRNAPSSGKSIVKEPCEEMTPKLQEICDGFCKEVGQPSPMEDCLLEGTITHRTRDPKISNLLIGRDPDVPFSI